MSEPDKQTADRADKMNHNTDSFAFNEAKQTVPEFQIDPPRKSISTFLASEKGGITKKALIDSAVAAGFVFALSQAVSAQVIHSNSLSITGIENPKATGTHGHHSQHSQHSYHSSY